MDWESDTKLRGFLSQNFKCK